MIITHKIHGLSVDCSLEACVCMLELITLCTGSPKLSSHPTLQMRKLRTRTSQAAPR